MAAGLAGARLPPAPVARARAPRTFLVSEAVLVHGVYPPRETTCVAGGQPAPLHLRLTGRVEVGLAPDGSLFVINELPFQTYLEGLAEVPRNWPAAALDAQVVAARTYALGRLGGDSTGRELGYDLCATDACQVYRGLGISHGPWGERWRAAVARTDGLALLHDGRPATTLYFSTSNGRTYGNEEVFDGAGPLPYLRSVAEDDDGASPVSRWTARIPLDDVARFLTASGDWPGGAVAAVSDLGEDLEVRGGGRRVRLTKTSFRIALNDRSTCLEPATYPGPDHEEDEVYRLPQTLPSKWFDARTEAGDLVADGRGWGHGVGMVQWGAYGKAKRGMGAEDILAFYYGGLRPRTAGVPDTIRVGVATGLRRVWLVAEDPSAVGSALPGDGPWSVEPGSPLRIRPARAPGPVLDGEVLEAPETIRAGRRTSLRAEASAGVNASIELVAADGARTRLPAVRPHARGTWGQRFTVAAGVAGGEYRVVVTMDDGIDTIRRAAPARTRVLAAPAVLPPPTTSPPLAGPFPRPPPGEDLPLAVPIGATALVLVAAGLLAARRHLRRG
ncbi:MAG: SpoIID/LytB domain-containing protein [Actinomycetota bacterium]